MYRGRKGMDLSVLVTIFGAIDGGLFLLLVFGAVFIGFIVCLFISIFKSGYSISRRAWFLIIVLLFYGVIKARAKVLGETDYSPIIIIFGAILFLPLYFIREKKVAKNPKESDCDKRDFVRFLDSKIKSAQALARKEQSQEHNIETITAKEREKSNTAGLDFSHVKNVLARLEPALLSYSDRKQIHDLELALYSAERGDSTEEIKTKINEGLGNLLKIMAKHGV